jgi:hypothetical protein
MASAPLQRAYVGLATTLCRALLDARLSTNSPYSSEKESLLSVTS